MNAEVQIYRRMIMRNLITLSVIIAMLAGATGAVTAEKNGKPENKIIVESVEGIARYKVGKEWRDLKQGQKLNDTTVILTGFSGRVVLHFRDETRVTVRSATKMGIREYSNTGKITKTRIDLKQGAIKAKVDSTRAPNDFRVNVHGTILAVTGTGGEITYWPDAGLMLYSFEHTWLVANVKGRRHVEEGTATNQNLESPDIILGKELDTRMADVYGLTEDEVAGLRDFGGGRGAFSMLGNSPVRRPTGPGRIIRNTFTTAP